MPPPVLDAYAVMLPRLQAAESILWSLRFSVGSGWMKRGKARSIMTRWQRTAMAGGGKPIRARSEALYRGQMRRMGIAVRRVPTAAPGPSDEVQRP